MKPEKGILIVIDNDMDLDDIDLESIDEIIKETITELKEEYPEFKDDIE